MKKTLIMCLMIPAMARRAVKEDAEAEDGTEARPRQEKTLDLEKVCRYI